MNFNISFNFFSITRTLSIGWEWIKFGIVTAAIMTSMVVSFWGSPIILILLLGLLLGLVAIVALIRQPNLGFIFIFLGGIVPVSGPSGLSMATVIVALMLGLWIMDMLVVRRHFVLIRSRVMTPILTLLVIAVVAFGMGQIPWFVFARQAPLDAQLGGFAIFICSIGGLLLSAHLIKDIYWLKVIVWVFLGLSAIYILGRAIGLSAIDRLYYWTFSAQSMFWTWLIALSSSQIIYNNQLTRRSRAMLIALVLLTFYVAIFQAFDWKSGWVPPVVSVLVLLGIRYRNQIVFATPFVVMIALYFAINLIATDEYSWGTRTDAWRIILEISRVSPLLGMGFANYYWYTPLFPIRGWSVSFNSHSQYVDLIAQTGYLGLIAFFWVFFAVGRLSFNLARRMSDGFARAYSYGVLAGIAATLVAGYLGDWVLPFVYNVGLRGFRASILPWIFMGGVIALEQMRLQDPNMPGNNSS
jgi:hypothetical protein